VPILLAERITADHDAPVTIRGVCRQQYKHGLGCGEAARRCPETLELEQLAGIVAANAAVSFDGRPISARTRLKSLVTRARARAAILNLAILADGLAPQWDALDGLYRLAIAAHFSAGVRDGLSQFRKLAA
jgi:hypothetical protein